MDTTIEGGCLCRAVRYRVSGEPSAKTLCHCRSCRLASGAPSLAWTVFRADAFGYLTGSPAEIESSPGVFRTFCGRCGTSLSWRSTERPETIDITTASLDEPDRFAPAKEIWVEHRIAWEELNPGIPHFARSSVGAKPIDNAGVADDAAAHSPAMTPVAINLQEKFAQFSDPWAPRVIAEMNDYQFKLVRILGEFVWHRHADTDEVFIVIDGQMAIEFRDGRVELAAGEMVVVPRSVEHRPVAERECKLMLVEPRGVVNTGEAGSAYTAPNDVWI